ncbi:hypothetical protein Efla_005819 [Eimeria flavescens]
MGDLYTDNQLGRKVSPKCASPTFGELSDASPGRGLSLGLGARQSPSSSELQEYVCVVSDEVKLPATASASAGVHALGRACADEAADSSEGAGEVQTMVEKFCRAFSALGVYVGLSILTVFWTKHLVGGRVPTPLFLSWVQQAVGLLVHVGVSVSVAAACGERSAVGRALSRAIPVVRVKPRLMLRVLPLSLCFVGMIGAANLCLQRVQVSVYQVARSLTLVFSLLLSVVWLKQKVVKAEVFSCLLVAAGFALMTAVGTSGAASVSGYVMGALASLFQAMYTVQMKATINAIQQTEEEEQPAPSRKRQSAYQPISGDAPACSSPAGGGGDPKLSADSPLEASLPFKSAFSVPPLDACALSEAEPAAGESRQLAEEEAEGESLEDEEPPLQGLYSLSVEQQQQQQQAACGERGSPKALLSPTEFQLRHMSLESGGSRGARAAAAGEGTEGRGGPLRGAPRGPSGFRAEPLCMFYNMLNALCLFPLVILLSDEPAVLRSLAADGLLFSTADLSQIVGIGLSNYLRAGHQHLLDCFSYFSSFLLCCWICEDAAASRCRDDSLGRAPDVGGTRRLSADAQRIPLVFYFSIQCQMIQLCFVVRLTGQEEEEENDAEEEQEQEEEVTKKEEEEEERRGREGGGFVCFSVGEELQQRFRGFSFACKGMHSNTSKCMHA